MVVTHFFIACMAIPIPTSYSPYTSKNKINKVTMDEVRTKLSGILNDNLRPGMTVKDTLSKRGFTVKSVKVTNEGVDFIGKNQQKHLAYIDLLNKNLNGNGFQNSYFDVVIPKVMTITLLGDKNSGTLMDYLYFIQRKLLVDSFNKQLKDFEPRSAAYRNLKMKPPVSEEQRKYVVQANALNEQKLYSDAAKLYIKAMKVDETSYPAGYFNIALLDAQMGYYDNAIYEMKKYLMLVPDAPDARNAQDKIYEWDIYASE